MNTIMIIINQTHSLQLWTLKRLCRAVDFGVEILEDSLLIDILLLAVFRLLSSPFTLVALKGEQKRYISILETLVP